eukprot:6662793-Lingulodinium_polyedra.AAC.1
MRSKAFSWSAKVTAGQRASCGWRTASSEQSWASGAPAGPMTSRQRSSRNDAKLVMPIFSAQVNEGLSNVAAASSSSHNGLLNGHL